MSFTTAIQRGGMVTVMNAAVISSSTVDFYGIGTPEAAYQKVCSLAKDNMIAYIDHFKTANLNASGPTITITGGQDANPLIKFGKTMKCEMQMALCQIDALEALGGVETTSTVEATKTITLSGGDAVIVGDVITNTNTASDIVFNTFNSVNSTEHTTTVAKATGEAPTTTHTVVAEEAGILLDSPVGYTLSVKRIYKNGYKSYTVTNKFPGAVTIVGDTFVVDQASGDQVPVKILIYKFLPDAVFNLAQDASNAATFDLNGDVLGVHLAEGNNEYHGTSFYSIIDGSTADLQADTAILEKAVKDKKKYYLSLANA